MSSPDATNPPLPRLSATAAEPAVAAQNEWGLSAEEVSVFTEPQRYINAPIKPGILRSPFREGVLRCDEQGLHFSGQENTPKKWLTRTTGVAQVILVVCYLGNSTVRIFAGRKSSVALLMVGVIFFSLAVRVAAAFINGRFRGDVSFSVPWKAIQELQLDKKLRFLTLVYEVPLPEGGKLVQHHLTLNKLSPASVAAVAHVIERFAPRASQKRYAAQEIFFKQQRNMLIVAVVLLLLTTFCAYAYTSGRIFP